MGHTEKLPEVSVQLNRLRLHELAAGIERVIKLLNVDDESEYEELLKWHCHELGNEAARWLEKRDQQNFTIKLSLSASYAFVKTWEGVDTHKESLLTEVIGKVMEAIDKAKH